MAFGDPPKRLRSVRMAFSGPPCSSGALPMTSGGPRCSLRPPAMTFGGPTCSFQAPIGGFLHHLLAHLSPYADLWAHRMSFFWYVGVVGGWPSGDTMNKYRISDLVKATGMSERAIRFYVQNGLLPPATRHGRGHNYTEEHLVRVRAIRRLRGEGLNVRQMRARLARISAADHAILGAPLPDARGSSAAAEKGTLHGAPEEAVSGGESWRRVTLLPGLEIHVRADATPFVLRTAAEIRERYSTAPVSPSP